ncbi:TrkA family potassium uptake protein [Motilimonas cestriensis]|uniref:TrkA family potassium uptake protein n=1 Tax=Motilimonas cestriensis TaxID=2742685 RepID=A0ABS8WFI4_9GAMM|nr:TrkA family potassium uptake protein [Motilimonas cestriensis]MCE2596411.1 TrkA family potassium uptake protein [Motilimonas cestriensis]
MRTVFVGAGQVSVETAKALSEKGHEVVIIENNKDKIDELSEEMDCSFLLGDGSHPQILCEVSPNQTDFLFCLTNSDQANVIASLIGHSLGFKRIVTSITDPQFESICHELGLMDTIIPSRTVTRYLVDMVSGSENIDPSSVIKDEARLFMLVVAEEEAVTAIELDLPEAARAICYYREGEFSLVDDTEPFVVGDEVVILTDSKHLAELKKRWPSTVVAQDSDEPKE